MSSSPHHTLIMLALLICLGNGCAMVEHGLSLPYSRTAPSHVVAPSSKDLSERHTRQGLPDSGKPPEDDDRVISNGEPTADAGLPVVPEAGPETVVAPVIATPSAPSPSAPSRSQETVAKPLNSSDDKLDLEIVKPQVANIPKPPPPAWNPLPRLPPTLRTDQPHELIFVPPFFWRLRIGN